MSNIQPAGVYFNPLMCHTRFLACAAYSNCRMKVGGSGRVSAEPDKASVMLGVVTENIQLEKAQNENAQIMSRVIESLIKNGILREEIITQSYQIQPQYDFVNGEQLFRGYRVLHEIKSEINNINLAGVIIDDAVKAGANLVSDISFSVSRPQKYYQAALNAALSDAIAKAASIGNKMNVYVNTIPVSIIEKSASATAPIPYMSVQTTAEIATPIQPGVIEITAMVEVEFIYSCNKV